MKSFFKITLLAGTFLLSAINVSADQETKKSNGEQVYQSNCMACHVVTGKPTIAPPIFAVKNHVLDSYPERDEFIEQIKQWVKAPKADEALMKGAIKKFGLMPAMPHVNDEDLQVVAEYLFDTDMRQPDWYKEHYKKEHGKAPEVEGKRYKEKSDEETKH